MRKSSAICHVGVMLLVTVFVAAAAASAAAGEEQGGHAGSRALLAKQCPPKMERNFQRKCVCIPGWEYRASTKKCHACLPGWYKPRRGNSKCLPCPNGTYYPKRAATKCRKCSGLVHPTRTKCQFGCKEHDDHSVIRYGRYWSVNWHVYYRGGVTNKVTAAQVCDNVRKTDSSAVNLIPAVITSENGAKVAANLAEFHFKCERKPEGQTNYDYAYFAWISKGWEDPNPAPGQCANLFHTKGSESDGTSNTLEADQCVGDDGELLPVLCTRGCARFCRQCGPSGKCQQCVAGYTPVRGVCKRNIIKPLS